MTIRLWQRVRQLCLAHLVAATLVACGSGNDGSPPGLPQPPQSPPPPTSYTVGGTVAGLDGSLSLRNNAADDLTLSSDGPFSFVTPLADGSSYNVTISAVPIGQQCSVANGSGTIAGADVSNVAITCADIPSTAPAGTLDDKFGVGGKVTTDFSGAPLLFSAKPSSLHAKSAAASGAPQMLVYFLETPPGFFPATQYDPVGQEQQYGGILERQRAWGASNGGTDFAESHVDDTGTFWTYSERNFNNFDASRPGIGSGVTFIQRYRKDADDASLGFVVTSALLHVYRGVGRVATSGASAGFDASVTLHRYDADTGWLESTVFRQAADLETQVGGESWEPLAAGGPMSYAFTIDQEDEKQVAFDPYAGTLDLTSLRVGEEFTVIFNASTIAATGPAELPATAAAYFRDPVSNGGGMIVSPEGLTPLDTTTAEPQPRDRALAQAMQPDGKVVVAGQAYANGNYDFALARYSADGSLDASFGTAGKLTTDFVGGNDGASAVAIQPDGKIIVAGTVESIGKLDFALARYDASGALDPSFGNAGKVTLESPGYDDAALAIAIQSDGKIVVAGHAWDEAHHDVALARFDSSGNPDLQFGNDGTVLTDFAGATDAAEAIALQSDGALVVAGYSDGGATRSDLLVARYRSDGSLDTTFGVSGWVTADVNSGSDYANALALQLDGNIVVAGSSYDGANNDFVLARFTKAGVLDSSFGASGLATIDYAVDNDIATALAIQSDGKLLVGGYATNGAHDDFAVARLLPDGTLDAAFGDNGKVLADFAGSDDRISTLAIQGSSRVVAAGYALTSTGEDFALVALTL
jgi:uncharacterized delta-60 repeat protein